MAQHICIIDDDTIYQLIVKRLVNRTGIFKKHTQFFCAQNAIEMFKNNNEQLPDFILLDINMPGMDGWQFIERLKEVRPLFNKETRIYIVSSSIAEADFEKTKKIKEINGFITKPFDEEKLMSLAKKQCRNK